MLTLGLGSNRGDRVGYLRQAVQELLRRKILLPPIRISKVYDCQALLPPNAPAAWNINFLNAVIQGESQLSGAQALQAVKQIEKDLGRVTLERWSPREIDIDILLLNEERVYENELQIPHSEILHRDFVLAPLSDLETDLYVQGRRYLISELRKNLHGSLAKATELALLPTELMGVVNLTPDSFSDGGQYVEIESISTQIRSLIRAGASIIDIGAESTRPQAKEIAFQDELSRLAGVLSTLPMLKREFPWIKWSIDTRHAETAEAALEAHFDWVNDVSGGDSAKMRALWRASKCRAVFMHHLGVPVQPDRVIPLDQDLVKFLMGWAKERVEHWTSEGLARDALIFDPGIGFGKTARQSSEILSRVREFEALGLPILIGHSRKSFLKLISDRIPEERDLETGVISAFLAQNSVDYVRVHAVEDSVRSIRASLLVSGLA